MSTSGRTSEPSAPAWMGSPWRWSWPRVACPASVSTAWGGPSANAWTSCRSACHRSLAAAIAWSYDLLDADERSVLLGAAVFAAPFDLDAICAVVDLPSTTVLGALARLVDWNLVSLRPGWPSRYRVLETIRQYAMELPGAELGTLRTAHL